jgi:hypothetical protein
VVADFAMGRAFQDESQQNVDYFYYAVYFNCQMDYFVNEQGHSTVAKTHDAPRYKQLLRDQKVE